MSTLQMTPNWRRHPTGSGAELPLSGTCRVLKSGPQEPGEIQQGQMLRSTHGKGDHPVMILGGEKLCLKTLEQFSENELGEHELNGSYWY